MKEGELEDSQQILQGHYPTNRVELTTIQLMAGLDECSARSICEDCPPRIDKIGRIKRRHRYVRNRKFGTRKKGEE